MPKTVKSQRPAAKPGNKPLILTVRLRPEVVDLFNVGLALCKPRSPEQFAELLIIKGLTSEVIMERFDKLVNRLL